MWRYFKYKLVSFSNLLKLRNFFEYISEQANLTYINIGTFVSIANLSMSVFCSFDYLCSFNIQTFKRGCSSMIHTRFMTYRVQVICRQIQKVGAVNHRPSEARLSHCTVIDFAEDGIYLH